METLEQYSILLVYSAMAIYALAFISFALDLARRSSQMKAAAAVAAAPELVGASVSGAGLSHGTPVSDSSVSAASGTSVVGGPNDGAVAPKRSVSLRIGVSLTILGFLLQLVGVVLRGVAAERVPWANMYEFSITGTLLIMAVFLIVLTREDLRFLGTFITGLVLILLGVSTVNYYVAVVPLPPALESAWLVIHVFVASLGTAFFALGGALSGIQLLQNRREASPKSRFLNFRLLDTLPNSVRLENLAYRINIVGFVFWTFTLIAGAVWAERAWGRYWGWDTKEVWTFIIWVIYAGYIHARATKGWRGSRSAWLALIGFAAVLFNFGVVNVFFKGLHAYSGL
ncbi:c-type cytochrome biogenesis protein CcsB [Agreia pratensis]|nr:c-type cytochrome biogenesis protein CcsB [Agreia pratensis]